MHKTFLFFSLLCGTFLRAEEVNQQEKALQILQYFEHYGINLNDPDAYTENYYYEWALITQELSCTYASPILIDYTPILTAKSDYASAAAFIVFGICLYGHPFTRGAGIRLIQIGCSIIGFGNLSDFWNYAAEKGWVSNDDWNVFKKILGNI